MSVGQSFFSNVQSLGWTCERRKVTFLQEAPHHLSIHAFLAGKTTFPSQEQSQLYPGCPLSSCHILAKPPFCLTSSNAIPESQPPVTTPASSPFDPRVVSLFLNKKHLLPAEPSQDFFLDHRP